MGKMPTLATHSRIRKRTGLLLKKNNKSFKPLYKKLKSNNNFLAKALSQQKQECQLLFNENVALNAQVANLGLACKRRDDVLENVAQNAKEMLKVIGTLTNFFGNIISSCQQFKYNSGNNLLNASKTARRSSTSRRLSTKSPARGVVQPMVSGHMITKPTINLSRVNMQNIQNSQLQNLSTIEESPVPTPNRRLEQNRTNSNTPSRASIPKRLNCEKRRTFRLPTRLTVSASDDEDARLSSGENNRLSERRSSKHSRRSSQKSFANRSLNEHNDSHADERIRNSRVELNDVSKLLQNSQSINIRTLTENSNSENKESRSSDKLTENTSLNSTASGTSESSKSLNSSIESPKVDENVSTSAEVNTSLNNNSAEMDPLEGPSWKYNFLSPHNGRNMRNKKKKYNLLKILDDDSLDSDDDEYNQDEKSVNLRNFVTRERGSIDVVDIDEFTLCLTKPKKPVNHNFDINDFDIPVLVNPLGPPVTIKDPESEITSNLQSVTQTLPSSRMEDTVYENMTLKLPRLSDMDLTRKESIFLNKDVEYETTEKNRKRKINKKLNVVDSPEEKEFIKVNARNRSKKTKADVKDPSTAKVVLKKLVDQRIKKRSSSSENDKKDEDSIPYSRSISHTVDFSSDSESSNSSYSRTSRPKRQKAPTNLQEPSLNKKLRRPK